MKFGKVLKVSSENMPADMRDLFLRYKELKKQIKAIPVNADAAAGAEKHTSTSFDASTAGSVSTGAPMASMAVLSPEEQAFITTLNEDLARFNRYFIEKEEEAVIRLQALCDEVAAAAAALGLQLPPGLVNGTFSDTEDAPAATAATARHPAPQRPQQQQPPPPHQHQQQAQGDVAEAVLVAPCCGLEPATAREAAAAAGAAGAVGAQQDVDTDTPAAAAAEASGLELGEGGAAQEAPVDEQQRLQQQPPHHQHHHHHRHDHLHEIKARLVQFHGEMVLLLHWSLLNYAAVVKILKKHDKRSGVLLRAPYLANVLQQPFSSTTIMSRLAKRAEQLVVLTTQMAPAPQQQLAALRPGAPSTAAAAHAAGAGGDAGVDMVVPSAEAAARALQGDVAAARPHAAESEGAATTAVAFAPGMGTAGAAGVEEGAAARVPLGAARGAATSASEASSLTYVAERGEGAFAAGKHAEPLVGRTMHALETWANLRKNAITPSTVIAAAEVEQPAPAPLLQPCAKRRAETSAASEAEAEADIAGGHVAKLAKTGDAGVTSQ
ncbi:hypothetical protein Agub_g2192 [Astrephomene gubernaculifera]|uniref:SPX domain-containing protein n=1 Tax=Astrephomene gubernaculifera TaxID=47775 RepID=A0AAD3DIU0_9CHLO|nr:hypothetical protein Agub_g2192 [Astrephomene gubernaculifera]